MGLSFNGLCTLFGIVLGKPSLRSITRNCPQNQRHEKAKGERTQVQSLLEELECEKTFYNEAFAVAPH